MKPRKDRLKTWGETEKPREQSGREREWQRAKKKL
jgi:hypothetical protein